MANLCYVFQRDGLGRWDPRATLEGYPYETWADKAILPLLQQDFYQTGKLPSNVLLVFTSDHRAPVAVEYEVQPAQIRLKEVKK